MIFAFIAVRPQQASGHICTGLSWWLLDDYGSSIAHGPCHIAKLAPGIGQLGCYIILPAMGGMSMKRTIYTSICGALMFIAALIPAAILIIDKAGF